MTDRRIHIWAAPSRLLNPAADPGTDWARAAGDGDDDAARSYYVAALREGSFLPDVASAYIPLAERWTGVDFGRHGGHDYDPDDVVKQHYVGVYGIEHTFEGEIDWMHDPTADWGERHTAEWQVQFNRHYHWIALARAWERTGNSVYAEAFEKELRSWVGSQCPAPPHKDMRLPGTWRTIEAGIRAGWTWPLVLEIFRRCEHIGDQALWLMVAALHEHGRYLMVSPTSGNFKTMEALGLAHVGMLLPQLHDAAAYASTAIDRAIAEMERQFYPDGCQNELASSYGRLSTICTLCTFRLAENTGLADGRGTEIHARLWDRIQRMGTVHARIATPEGRVPGLHDCDGFHVEPMASEIAGPENAPDYRHAEGLTLLPWGGYAVLRSENRWSLLDAGPWGNGHQHSDALQVLTWADGDFWCTDPGKPTYDGSATTHLIRSAEGHNVVLMDGRRHRPEPQLHRVDQPLPMAIAEAPGVLAAAALRETQIDGAPGFRHERLLLDLTDIGWLVIDRLAPSDDAPHTWEWLWHLPAETVVTLQDTGARATRADGARLRLLQSASVAREMQTFCGSEEPLRGWAVARGAATAHAIPLLAAKSDATRGRVTAATLLIPGDAVAETPALTLGDEATRVACRIGGNRITVALRGSDEWRAMAVSGPWGDNDLQLAPHAFYVARNTT